MELKRKTPQEHIDALVSRGGYAPDVIQTDDEWITLTRERLVALIEAVQADTNETG